MQQHHHHYLTIEQREILEKLLRLQIDSGARLKTELDYLHQPDYGVCIECSKDIGFALLEEDPLAVHCRDCRRLPVAAKP